jgi:hypothetical protein
MVIPCRNSAINKIDRAEGNHQISHQSPTDNSLLRNGWARLNLTVTIEIGRLASPEVLLWYQSLFGITDHVARYLINPISFYFFFVLLIPSRKNGEPIQERCKSFESMGLNPRVRQL